MEHEGEDRPGVVYMECTGRAEEVEASSPTLLLFVSLGAGEGGVDNLIFVGVVRGVPKTGDLIRVRDLGRELPAP
jgi:hypothetical protein